MTTIRPLLGITIGDPAGIGPEITLKALKEEEFYRLSRPLVIGRPGARAHPGAAGLSLEIHRVKDPSEGRYTAGTVDVLDMDNIDVSSLQMGVIQEHCGRAAFEYIQRAAEWAKEGAIDAIVTAPINKESLKAAGVPYIGHTEMLAAMAGSREEMTMFQIQNVKIFFLTRHLPLAEACRKIRDADFVYGGIRRAYSALSSLTGKKPTLAVAALNPHAGEGGLLGTEEIEGILPAVQRAQREGMDVVGPVPADSVFHFARRGPMTPSFPCTTTRGTSRRR